MKKPDKMYLMLNHTKHSANHLISFLFSLVLSGLSLLGLSNLTISTVLFFNVLQLDLLERTSKSTPKVTQITSEKNYSF